jgi:hypothetical protein
MSRKFQNGLRIQYPDSFDCVVVRTRWYLLVAKVSCSLDHLTAKTILNEPLIAIPASDWFRLIDWHDLFIP